MNTRFTALAVYNVEFRDCARSPEWKAGALRGLQKALGEPCPTGSPYDCGTAADDAWRAGFQDGRTGGYMRDGFDGFGGHGFKPDAGVIGAGYVPPQAAAPCHAGSAERSAAEAIAQPHAPAPLVATLAPHGGHQ